MNDELRCVNLINLSLTYFCLIEWRKSKRFKKVGIMNFLGPQKVIPPKIEGLEKNIEKITNNEKY